MTAYSLARYLHIESYNIQFRDMETRTINPVQLHLLEMFKYCKSEQTVLEMKDVLADFYAKKVQKEADRLWDEGKLNGEAIEQILQEHWRTPYKEA